MHEDEQIDQGTEMDMIDEVGGDEEIDPITGQPKKPAGDDSDSDADKDDDDEEDEESEEVM